MNYILQESFVYSLFSNYTSGVDADGLKNLIADSPPVVQFMLIQDFNYDSVVLENGASFSDEDFGTYGWYFGAAPWNDIICINVAYYAKNHPESGSRTEDLWISLIVISVLYELGHWFIRKTGSTSPDDPLNPGEIECGNRLEFDCFGGRIGTLSRYEHNDEFQIEGLYVEYGDGVQKMLSARFVEMLLNGDLSCLRAESEQMKVEKSSIPVGLRKNKINYELKAGNNSAPNLVVHKPTWRDKRPTNTLTMNASTYPAIEDMESKLVQWFERDIPWLNDDQKAQLKSVGLKQLREK